MPVKMYCCYAHGDQTLLNKLKFHLAPLQREGLIDTWHDCDISAKTGWEGEVDEHLEAAQIILLLISPEFLASAYCDGVEMSQTMERHYQEEATVIPIILHSASWEEVFGTLQVLPRDGEPVMSSRWHSLDEAFLDIAEGIHEALDEVASRYSITNKQSFTRSDQYFRGEVKASRVADVFGAPIQVGPSPDEHASISSQTLGANSLITKRANVEDTVSSHPAGAQPDRQSTINRLLCQLVDETSALERDICSETVVRFGVKSWDTPLLKPGRRGLKPEKEWPPSGRLLLFTIEDKRQSLDFQLGLGWSPAGTDTREKLFRMAFSNEPPFRPSHFQQLPPQWVYLYRRKMLDPQTYTKLSDRALEAELRKEWTYFIEEVLPRLDAVLKKQEWFR